MINKIFTMHSDSAHAWLEVPYTVLFDLGLMPNRDFSSYSYTGVNKESGAVIWLEEDCDLGIFLHHYMACNGGKRPIMKDLFESGESFVRTQVPCRRGDRFDLRLKQSMTYFKCVKESV